MKSGLAGDATLRRMVIRFSSKQWNIGNVSALSSAAAAELHLVFDLAVQLIDSKSDPFKADECEDHYATALTELVQTKVQDQEILAPPEAHRQGHQSDGGAEACLEGEAATKKKPATRKKTG